MNNNMLKSQIRTSVRICREALEEDQVRNAGRVLAENLTSIEDEELEQILADAKTVALYCAVRGELPCDDVAELFLSRGCTVCYPRVRGEEMDFYEVTDRGSQLTEGSYGIPEPKQTCRKIDAGSIDIMLVPAVAYTEDGSRLGRGGGYYDRWLNSASLAGKMPYTIGVCYDFQVYSALPVESHDHAVDMVLCVVTEEDDEE